MNIGFRVPASNNLISVAYRKLRIKLAYIVSSERLSIIFKYRLRYLIVLPLLLVSVIWLCWNIRIYLRGGFYFDDAFMFYRYAVNFHDGFGLVWNRGDDPAYGTTSLLWSFVVIGLSWPPLKASSLLALLSCLSGIASVGMLIYGVRALAGSGPLRSWINAAAFVLVPLGLGPHFKYHWTTGMDTMLAFFLLSGFVSCY